MKAALAMIALLALTACATMTTPETMKEKIFVAVEQTTAVVETANELRQNGTISTETHSDILSRAVEANELLNRAQVFVEAGEVTNAEDMLQAADGILVSLRNRLKEAEQDE